MAEIGMTRDEMEMMARYTAEGIGDYEDSVSYKLANNDLSVADVSHMTGIRPEKLEGWGWDEHEALLDVLGEPSWHSLASLPRLTL